VPLPGGSHASQNDVFPKNAQKKDRVRMPYKRISATTWTFSISRFLAILRKGDFFNNSHAWLSPIIPRAGLSASISTDQRC
jgi:hypothetical protein